MAGAEIKGLFDFLFVVVSDFIHFFWNGIEIIQVDVLSVLDEDCDLLREGKNIFDKADDVNQALVE